MKYVKKLFVLIILMMTCSSVLLQAQQKFSVTIQFPEQVNKEKISLHYDNGRERIMISPEFNENQITVSEYYYAKYATIEINYPKENGALPEYHKGFYITDKPATITFHTNETAANPLKNYSFKYAYALDSLGAEKLKSFIAVEEEDFFGFLNTNMKKMATNDSLAQLAFEKGDRLLAKKTEFVKLYGGSYYTFWLFRREIAYNNTISGDSLLAIFDTTFSDSLKQSQEGAEIVKFIRGRNLKKGQKAPDFITTDVHGETISLDNYRGKHVLINFWASWCGPCIEEMPAITALRKQYSVDNLAIIFFTLDEDSAAFAKAVKKYNIEGTHIFANKDLIKTYGAQAIPKVYLIDPYGKIIYNRNEEEDYLLTKLNQVIKSSIDSGKK